MIHVDAPTPALLMFVSEYVTSTHLVLYSPSDRGSPYLQLIHMNGRVYEPQLLSVSFAIPPGRHATQPFVRLECDLPQRG